jgi:nitroimidazol reductase NimA-like FMN-containing flavoprotein (pyridoxamine 5'-phosphate oxidase superfamily)
MKMSVQQVKPKRTRPAMPNYGITTAPEGMLTWDWVVKQMADSRNYWICTTRPDGRPHATPVWGVWLDGNLYFGCDAASVKAKNLQTNPHVAVHLESGDEAVMFEGTVELVTDVSVLERMADAYFEKYPPWRPELDENGSYGHYYILKPQRAYAWVEKEYLTSVTRWDF